MDKVRVFKREEKRDGSFRGNRFHFGRGRLLINFQIGYLIIYGIRYFPKNVSNAGSVTFNCEA